MGQDQADMRLGVPVLLREASAGPFDSEPDFMPVNRAHLRRMAGIAARESVTYDYLMTEECLTYRGGRRFEQRMVNIALLFLTRFLTLVGAPIISLLVVRYLGPATYGQYASASAVVGLFGFLADFGVQQTVLRFGATSLDPAPVLKRGIVVSCLYTGAAVAIIGFWISIFPYDPLVRQLVVLQSLGLVRTPLLSVVTAGLQLQGKYGRIASWNLGVTVVHWLATIVAMIVRLPVLALVGVPTAASTVLALAMFVIEGREFGVFERAGLSPGARIFLVESWKFGTAGTMYQIYHKADAAILSVARSTLEVGHYSVAMRMAEMANVIPGIVFNQVLYPKYFRWSHNNRQRLKTIYRLMTKFMLLLGANVAAFIILFGRDLVSILFEMDDEVFSIIFPALAVGVMLHFWAASPGAILTTDGHVSRKIWIQGVTAAVSLALNSVLIPTHGAPAAAIVFAFSQLLLGALYTGELRRLTGFEVFAFRWRTTGLLGFVAALLFAVWNLNGSSWFIRGSLFVFFTVVSGMIAWFGWLTGQEKAEVATIMAPLNVGRLFPRT